MYVHIYSKQPPLFSMNTFELLIQYMVKIDKRLKNARREADRFADWLMHIKAPYDYSETFDTVLMTIHQITDHPNWLGDIQYAEGFWLEIKQSMVIWKTVEWQGVPRESVARFGTLRKAWLLAMETFLPMLGQFIINTNSEPFEEGWYHPHNIPYHLRQIRELLNKAFPVVDRVSIMYLLRNTTVTVLCSKRIDHLDESCPIKKASVLGSNVMRRAMEFVC